MMSQTKYPPGWDEERVRKVLRHYEEQTEEEAITEDEDVPRIVESDQETNKFDLPADNRTADAEINELSTRSSRVVITKDTDFVDSFLLFHRPHKLLLLSTGNITNSDLEDLFVGHIPAITTAFESYEYLELTRDTLIFHS
jgi:predicted nuclease of predicted toxin-antitoxin system